MTIPIAAAVQRITENKLNMKDVRVLTHVYLHPRCSILDIIVVLRVERAYVRSSVDMLKRRGLIWDARSEKNIGVPCVLSVSDVGAYFLEAPLV